MTKSEKNVLADVVGMLNALVNGNSDGEQHNQPAPQEEAAPADEEPSQEEIAFIKEVRADGEIAVKGVAINHTKEEICSISISPDCFGRMLDAYLEKYDHE